LKELLLSYPAVLNQKKIHKVLILVAELEAYTIKKSKGFDIIGYDPFTLWIPTEKLILIYVFYVLNVFILKNKRKF
jgi:hypothetical protein